jgi:hypothetical protein
MLFASDGAADDRFGCSVSLSGDTLLIGAWGHGENGQNSGAVYAFVRDNDQWIEQAEILPTPAQSGRFGYSVSLSGDTAVVGGFDRSAFIVNRSGDVWQTPLRLSYDPQWWEDHFGRSVSISGDTAVVGAWGDFNDNGSFSGAVYVFTRIENYWHNQARLIPPDGATNDRFGDPVSISGDTVVIGAWGDDDNGSTSGSAYVFVRGGTEWSQQAKLLPADGEAWDYFGSSVSVSGDTAIIGSQNDEDGYRSGSAYVFTRSGNEWSQQAKLLPADGEDGDDFGWSVSVSGDTAVIGAPHDDDNGNLSGSIYVFTRSGTVWTEQFKYTPNDSTPLDKFGESVHASSGTIAIGIQWDDGVGVDSGSVHVIDINCGSCPADLAEPYGVLDLDDVNAFVVAFLAGEPIADLDGDGVFALSDMVAFIEAFLAGCP